MTTKWTHYVASSKSHTWGKGNSLPEAMSNAGVTKSQRGWVAWEFDPTTVEVDMISGGFSVEQGIEIRCIQDNRYARDKKAYPITLHDPTIRPISLVQEIRQNGGIAHSH